MLEKKERILHTALEYFAKDGFNATSTNKIAKGADVSEGLIFRHFHNKKGLLKALVKEAEEKLERKLRPIMEETDPGMTIRKTILLPFSVTDEEKSYWKLQFKLKWEEEHLGHYKIIPLQNKLSWAFKQLEIAEPDYEAQLLYQIIDSVSIELVRGQLIEFEAYKSFLLKKYNC